MDLPPQRNLGVSLHIPSIQGDVLQLHFVKLRDELGHKSTKGVTNRIFKLL